MPRGTPLADDPLDLWRSIAELSPRALPEPGFARRDVTIKDYLRDHRFPWDPVTGHRDGRGTWRHTVFAGLLPYRTLLVRAGLAFDADGARTGTGPSSRDDRADAAGRPAPGPGPEPDPAPGPAPGGADPYRIPSSDLTPLLALQVDQDGVVDVGTLAVSRACWAALALSGFGRAVTDFGSDSRTWREAMLGTLRARGVRLSDGSGGGSRALERADLVELVEETHRVFEAGALRSERIVNSPVRVASLRTDGPTARIPALPLIDHPAAAALDEAARGSRFRQAAAGLLGIEAPEVREDVAAAPRLMYSGVAPRELPLGVAEAEGASVATQFSVNRALAELGGDEGLWSVPASLVHGVDPARARRMLVAALLTRRGAPSPTCRTPPRPSTPSPRRRPVTARCTRCTRTSRGSASSGPARWSGSSPGGAATGPA
ncbi:hypothetical protein NBM05_07250 [Rothia sp. AR01]|uniref:Uncharacterized protein n=1 Tax=Rothia santali TaxID=2949643 RepID=A0A9X2HFG9_9MICC|nr:hypothetical protein [Rothia santali]MCP3425807.1 hypothetical protein [Rothia santali]